MYNGADKYGGGVSVNDIGEGDSSEQDIAEILSAAAAEESVVLQAETDNGVQDVLLCARIDPDV